jgi:hypothetical protein
MKKPLLLLAPAALLFLASCSSEPSDWRADNKVSLDMVPPGTRTSDNFDQNTSAAPSQEKGGAIEAPHGSPSSGVRIDRRPAPSAGAVMSADTKPENAPKSVNSGSSSQSDTMATGKRNEH